MIEHPILFIFGAPRSGTTLVNGLLRSHFDYGLCAEGQFVRSLWRRVRHYGSLERRENLQRLIDDVLADQMMHIFRTKYPELVGHPLDVTSEEVWAELPEQSFAGVLYAVFKVIADKLGKSRVGNKCPDYWRILDLLREWFPNARFLHIVRDGRDVALSTMQQSWGEKSVYACAQKWRRVMESTDDFASRVGPDAFCCLKYEDLLTTADRVLAGLELFLDTDLDGESRRAFLQRLTENDRRRNFGHWREKMASHDQEVFEAVAGNWLQKCEYETLYDAPHVPMVERVTSTAREYLRRVQRTLCALTAGQAD